jgi:hypothetical protein
MNAVLAALVRSCRARRLAAAADHQLDVKAMTAPSMAPPAPISATVTLFAGMCVIVPLAGRCRQRFRTIRKLPLMPAPRQFGAERILRPCHGRGLRVVQPEGQYAGTG